MSYSRVSWGAIFAGAFVTLALLSTIGFLGMGIGLMGGTSSAAGAKALGVGAVVWLLIDGIISFYVGGWTAGRLTGVGRISENVVHGFVSWALASVALLFIVTGTTMALGGILSGLVPYVGGGATGGATAAPGTVSQLSSIAGGAGIFAFILMAIECFCSCIGARAGTRPYAEVPQERYSREKIGV